MSAPETPPFDAPWQAQAFALTVALAEAGVFTWPAWSEALGARLNGPSAAPDGSDYYVHWLATLEEMLATANVVAPATLAETAAAWRRAAAATPHGVAITLDRDPEGAITI
ncbi:MAG: nitrile hydratase accessory protein [Pseudomonadota bacterium]